VAGLDPVTPNLQAKSGLFYYWYEANEIHMTQGGYSGKLLNGVYTEYYKNKNLKTQGGFKNGLKDGHWKSWNTDGVLLSDTDWKHGHQVVRDNRSIWQKMLFFRKTRADSDSLKKPTK